MKYLIIHAEGFADRAQSSLGGKSLLEAADTPNLDSLARAGEFGWVSIPIEGMAPRGELTGLSVLGYDPKKYSTGPAPLEAVGLGISVGEHDVVYRAQLVTLRSEHAPPGRSANSDAKKLSPLAVLEDATGGGIQTEDARELIDALNEGIGSETIQFYPGSGHHHYMVWVNGKFRAVCTDPLVVEGHAVGEHLPNGDGADMLRKVMEASLVVLRDHPVNLDRREAGQRTATCMWLWGQGRAPQWPPLPDVYGISGAMVSTSMLHRGLGVCAGLESVELDGEASGVALLKSIREEALHELGRKDLVWVHTDLSALVGPEATHQDRTKAVEAFDRELVGPLVQAIHRGSSGRVLMVCDQSETPTSNRGATYQALAAVADPAAPERSHGAVFSEAYATRAGGAMRDGLKLLGRLLKK